MWFQFAKFISNGFRPTIFICVTHKWVADRTICERETRPTKVCQHTHTHTNLLLNFNIKLWIPFWRRLRFLYKSFIISLLLFSGNTHAKPHTQFCQLAYCWHCQLPVNRNWIHINDLQMVVIAFSHRNSRLFLILILFRFAAYAWTCRVELLFAFTSSFFAYSMEVNCVFIPSRTSKHKNPSANHHQSRLEPCGKVIKPRISHHSSTNRQWKYCHHSRAPPNSM